MTTQGAFNVNPTNYRQVRGGSSFEVVIPKEFAREMGLKHGTNVRIDFDGKKLTITNADNAVNYGASSSKEKR